MNSTSRRIPSLALAAYAFLFGAVVPLPADEASPACKALENSALAEPDWYADVCLGGRLPKAPTVPNAPDQAGDILYLVNVRGQTFLTAPLPTLTYTNLGPQTNPLFAVDFDNAATTLWAINNTTRQWGTLNQATGVFTPAGVATGFPMETITGMKFDPTSSAVYVSTATQLFTINLGTGVATLVGSFGGAPTNIMIDIAISNTGQMYGHEISADQLVSINKATGLATPIGSTGLLCNFAQGMDFDPSTNTLYALPYLGGGVDHLATVNLNTGAFTIVASGVNEENEGAIKVPSPTVSPFALGIAGGNGNIVLEFDETVDLQPSWRNNGGLPINVTGVLSNFIGPAGPTYTITDGTSSYGTIASNNSAICTDCYGLNVVAAARPVQHWDATALETMSPTGTSKTWTLHIGESFTDVSKTNPFYRFVETIFHKSITAGCGGTDYCPSSSTTREQMAVFVLVAKDGSGVPPPACAPPNTFGDVPESSPFCRFIEELAARGVVTGCGGGNYCPAAPVTREQMSVFVLKTLDPSLDPPACAPPNTFNDVPETSGFCRWIEELAARGVVTGCGGGNYCPTDPVTREQMGVFLTETFGLKLYGP